MDEAVDFDYFAGYYDKSMAPRLTHSMKEDIIFALEPNSAPANGKFAIPDMSLSLLLSLLP